MPTAKRKQQPSTVCRIGRKESSDLSGFSIGLLLRYYDKIVNGEPAVYPFWYFRGDQYDEIRIYDLFMLVSDGVLSADIDEFGMLMFTLTENGFCLASEVDELYSDPNFPVFSPYANMTEEERNRYCW